jgi:hypothetical protein
LHDKNSLQSKAGLLVLVVSALALAFSLTFTRDRLALEIKNGAQPVASDGSLLDQ